MNFLRHLVQSDPCLGAEMIGLPITASTPRVKPTSLHFAPLLSYLCHLEFLQSTRSSISRTQPNPFLFPSIAARLGRADRLCSVSSMIGYEGAHVRNPVSAKLVNPNHQVLVLLFFSARRPALMCLMSANSKVGYSNFGNYRLQNCIMYSNHLNYRRQFLSNHETIIVWMSMWHSKISNRIL